MTTITLPTSIDGVIDDLDDTPLTVLAGTYEINDRDAGDAARLGLVVDGHGDLSDEYLVWINPATIGFVECDCHGSGKIDYRVHDEWESDDCPSCDGVGWRYVHPDARIAEAILNAGEEPI